MPQEYSKNKDSFKIDSDTLYKALFEKLPINKKINKDVALERIRLYLTSNSLMTPTLEKYLGSGFDEFILAFLQLALPAVQEAKASEDKKKPSAYQSVGEEEVRSWGWSPEYQVKICMSLDYETMDNLTTEHEGDTSQWVDIIRKRSDTWRILTDENKQVIGYWHFIPLFEEEYEKVINGEMLESEMRLEHIPRLFSGCDYDVFFSSLCLKDEYQGNTVVLKLLESIRDVVADLAKQDIFFRKVSTLGYTGEGKALCKHLGLKLNKRLEHGDIYITDMLSLLQQTPYLNRNGEADAIIKIYYTHYLAKRYAIQE